MQPFEAGKRRILWFTRGRGRGHAVPDMALAEEFGQLRPDCEIRFVSYATGARTFAERGIPCIDLELPEANGIADTTVLAGRLIGALQPEVIVAHEEFSVMPVAKIFGLPTVMITDFFSDPNRLSMDALWYADVVLFTGARGVFEEPPSVRGKVRYTGAVLRPFAYQRPDRARAREELWLPSEATVITVLPGSWREEETPLAGPALAAFDALPSPKFLVWVGGVDAGLIREQVGARGEVRVVTADWQIDRLMAASDLAVTKANRCTVHELAALGIRTLSVSYGRNPPDEQAIAKLASNQTVPVEQFRGFAEALSRPEPRPKRVRPSTCARRLAKLVP